MVPGPPRLRDGSAHRGGPSRAARGITSRGPTTFPKCRTSWPANAMRAVPPGASPHPLRHLATPRTTTSAHGKRNHVRAPDAPALREAVRVPKCRTSWQGTPVESGRIRRVAKFFRHSGSPNDRAGNRNHVRAPAAHALARRASVLEHRRSTLPKCRSTRPSTPVESGPIRRVASSPPTFGNTAHPNERARQAEPRVGSRRPRTSHGGRRGSEPRPCYASARTMISSPSAKDSRSVFAGLRLTP